MLKEIFLPIFLFFVGFLEHTFFANFVAKNINFHLLLLFFVLFIFFEKENWKKTFFYPLAFFAGLSLDLFSPFYFGAYILIFFGILKTLQLFFGFLAKKSFFVFLFIIFLALFEFDFLEAIFLSLTSGYFYFPSFFSIIYNLLLGCLLYFGYVFFKKVIPNRKKGK